MKKKWRGAAFVIVVFVLALGGSPAWGGEAVVLSDAELEQVYGGSPDVTVTQNGCGGGPNSTHCVINIADTINNINSGISLTGNAQSNLQGVAIVNAVNSTVALQVNIAANNGGSVTGGVAQGNFAFDSAGNPVTNNPPPQ